MTFKSLITKHYVARLGIIAGETGARHNVLFGDAGVRHSFPDLMAPHSDDYV